MQQEDYIKRQIDHLGRILGKILADLLGFGSQGMTMENVESVIWELNEGIGLTAGDQFSVPEEEFIEQLKDVKGLNEENLDKLANIFILLAGGPEPAVSPDKKQKLYALSLAIFEHLETVSHTYSLDRHLKMDKTRQARKG